MFIYMEIYTLNLQDIRLKNGRLLLKQHGGTIVVSRRMGYKNASFLSQMFGARSARSDPEKSKKYDRRVSEGTCRKMEEVLGLPEGYMDEEHELAKPPAAPLNVSLLSNMIGQVLDLLAEEGLNLSNHKVAQLIEMAYSDGSTDRLRTVVQLLK